MRLFFLTFLFAVNCFAEEPAQKFVYHATKEFDHPSASQIYFISTDLSQKGYMPLNQSLSGNIPGIGVDQIFVKGDSAIFLKMGLRPSNKNILNQILKLGDGYAIHKHKNGHYWALYFFNHTLDQVNVAINEIENDRLPASAPNANCCLSVHNEDGPQKSSGLSSSIIGNTIKSCAVTGFNSAYETIKNEVTFAGLRSFLHDPGKLWREVVSSFSKIGEFIVGFEKNAAELFMMFSTIDLEISTQIACSVAGSLLPNFILKGLNFATAGASIILVLSQLKKLKPLVMALSKLKALGKTKDSQKSVQNILNPILACGA